METKFTKGKWKQIPAPGYHKPKASTIEIHSEKSNGWICMIQNNGVIGSEEGNSNAKLIAAAPEMFEGCCAAIAIFSSLGIDESHPIVGEIFKKITSAIKKATK